MYRNSDVTEHFWSRIYAQKEDEEESGAAFQAQPWKTIMALVRHCKVSYHQHLCPTPKIDEIPPPKMANG